MCRGRPASSASSLLNARMPIQVAQEKLQADIYERVNTCNMLLHQVRQRRQVREELQRRLQQLQDAAMPDKRQQAQAQVPGTPSWAGSTCRGL